MKKRNFACVMFCLCASTAWADEIRVAASDLLADFIEAPLQAYAEEQGIELSIDGIGSLPAMDRLRSDEIDLALIAVPEGEEVPRDEFSIYPFAYDATVIAVNGGNPLDELSVAHLGGIFGSNEEFTFNTWGELGLSGWGGRSIKPLAGAAPESIALELFRYSVFTGGAMRPSVAMVMSTEIEELLANDAASIGILSKLPENENVKVLMISAGEDAPAFGPTEDNVHYGDYPIRLSFYIAFNNRDQEKLKSLLRVLLEDEVANSLSENGLFSLPDTVRRQLLVDLDLEGER
jgi:ABC-type phosphate transport system substrate-binding protein